MSPDAMSLTMIGPISRYLMSGEYGPFDRVVELGVLGLIAYEVAVGVVRHRKAVKRQGTLDKITQILSDFMFKGQALQQSVPDPQQTTWETQEPWMKEVTKWIVDTSQFLQARSTRAGAAFLLVLNSSSSDAELIPLNGYSIRLHGLVRQRYQMLLGHLSNLRGIIEKPEAYF